MQLSDFTQFQLHIAHEMMKGGASDEVIKKKCAQIYAAYLIGGWIKYSQSKGEELE